MSTIKITYKKSNSAPKFKRGDEVKGPNAGHGWFVEGVYFVGGEYVYDVNFGADYRRYKERELRKA